MTLCNWKLVPEMDFLGKMKPPHNGPGEVSQARISRRNSEHFINAQFKAFSWLFLSANTFPALQVFEKKEETKKKHFL